MTPVSGAPKAAGQMALLGQRLMLPMCLEVASLQAEVNEKCRFCGSGPFADIPCPNQTDAELLP